MRITKYFTILIINLMIFNLSVNANNEINHDPNIVTVKAIGNWLEKYSERCGKITKLPLDDCSSEKQEQQLTTISKDVSIIKEFGNWLESCHTLTIGETTDQKFKECTDIKRFLHP